MKVKNEYVKIQVHVIRYMYFTLYKDYPIWNPLTNSSNRMHQMAEVKEDSLRMCNDGFSLILNPNLFCVMFFVTCFTLYASNDHQSWRGESANFQTDFTWKRDVATITSFKGVCDDKPIA